MTNSVFDYLTQQHDLDPVPRSVGTNDQVLLSHLLCNTCIAKILWCFTARHIFFIWAWSFHTGTFMASSSIMMPLSGLCLEYYSDFILELSCMHHLLCNHSCHIWADPCFHMIRLIAFEVGLFVPWGVLAAFLWKRENPGWTDAHALLQRCPHQSNLTWNENYNETSMVPNVGL